MRRSALRFLMILTALSQNFKSNGQDTALYFFAGNVSDTTSRRVQAEYFYFTASDKPAKIRYALEVVNCYKSEARFGMALEEINSVLNDTSLILSLPKELLYEVKFQQAFCLFLIDSCSASIKSISNLLTEYPDSIHSKNTALLSVFDLNHLENYIESRNKLTEYLLYHHGDTAGTYTNYRQAITTPYKSVRKTKNLARFLPGAGFIYSGKPAQGFTSLALNAVFLGYAAYSIYTGYYVTAVLTGVNNWMRFHSGGVRASVSLASKYNTHAKKMCLQSLDNFCFQKLSR